MQAGPLRWSKRTIDAEYSDAERPPPGMTDEEATKLVWKLRFINRVMSPHGFPEEGVWFEDEESVWFQRHRAS